MIKCPRCGNMKKHLFNDNDDAVCTKCTLETKFQRIDTRVISIKNQEVVLAVDLNAD